MALRWGADVRFVPSTDVMAPGPYEQLDAPEIAGVSSLDGLHEVAFHEGVAREQVKRVLAELAARAPLDGDPVLGRYPVGPLRVRCERYAPFRVRMLMALGGSMLRAAATG